MKNRPFLFQIATSHTNVCNIMLTSLHPLFKVVPPGFDHDLLLCNFDKGRRGDHKHKIIDRPLSQNKVHYLKYFCNWL